MGDSGKIVYQAGPSIILFKGTSLTIDTDSDSILAGGSTSFSDANR